MEESYSFRIDFDSVKTGTVRKNEVPILKK